MMMSGEHALVASRDGVCKALKSPSARSDTTALTMSSYLASGTFHCALTQTITQHSASFGPSGAFCLLPILGDFHYHTSAVDCLQGQGALIMVCCRFESSGRTNLFK